MGMLTAERYFSWKNHIIMYIRLLLRSCHYVYEYLLSVQGIYDISYGSYSHGVVPFQQYTMQNMFTKTKQIQHSKIKNNELHLEVLKSMYLLY